MSTDFTVRLDAYLLSRVWLSTAVAQSTDSSRPILCRTTAVEVFPTGVRLASPDSYLLIVGWVPADDQDEPDDGEVPDHVIVVRDDDQRATGLMSYLKGATNGQPEGKAEHVDVVLYASRPDTGAQPSLDPSLAAVKCTVEVPGAERLTLDTIDGPFPDWRPLVAGHREGVVSSTVWGPGSVLRLAKLSKLWGNVPLRLTFGGIDQPILVEFSQRVDAHLRVIAMPVRDSSPTPDPAEHDDPRLLDLIDGDRPVSLEVEEDPAGVAEVTQLPTRRRKKKGT